MLKKILLSGLLVVLAAPAVTARRKIEKSGEIKDGVFIDKTYHFQFKIHENWKPHLGKKKDPFRISLVQRDYGIPADYQSAPDYTTVPRIDVYAGKCNQGVFPFVDSLLSDTYSSKQKKTILKEFEILNQKDLIPRGRRILELGGSKAIRVDFQAKYVKEVQMSTSTLAGKRVYGSYGGTIVAVKDKDTNRIVIFHLMCEWEFFEPVMGEVMQMVGTFKWTDKGK